MRILILVFVLTFAQFSGTAQSTDSEKKIEQVQTALGTLVRDGQRAQIVLRDLTVLQGVVSSLSEDSFGLKMKGANRNQVIATVSYLDVLEITAKGVSISLIPDPALRPFGSWDDLMKIRYNSTLEVVLSDGRSISGRTGEITKNTLTLFNQMDNEKLKLSSDQIVAAYRVSQQKSQPSGSVADGARKGRKIGTEIGPTPKGREIASGIGGVIGTVAEAAATQKKERYRVLIYSK
jgi:hypothetical protein